MLTAAAALLFLAACAWLGAFLFTALRGLAEARLPVSAQGEAPLSGVAVRRERVITPIPGAPDGRRIRTPEGPGVYFEACDGYESLTPEMLEELDAAGLSALREAPPGKPGQARLVEDAVWYCFAIVTTIGLGDFTAATLPGRAISAILGLYGIIVVALVTSIIVNFYNETKNTSDPDETEGMETAEQ